MIGLVAETDREARANNRRRSAAIHKTRLEAYEADLDPIYGAEAVSLVARLTDESWAMAGLEKPQYSRSEIPIFFKPGFPE
jgi:hypothetical protein